MGSRLSVAAMWGLCCCREPPGHDEGEGRGREEGQGVTTAIRSALYNRIGRVEHFRHKDTLVFLGFSLLLMFSLLVLVQYLARPSTCDVTTPLGRLPMDVQKMLGRGKYTDMEWRCHAAEDHDLVFRMIISPFAFDSDKSHTAIVPQSCRMETLESDDETNPVASSCPGWPDCSTLEKYIWDDNCHLEVPVPVPNEEGSSVWGWYFSLMCLVLGSLLVFVCLLRVSIYFCGGKREGVVIIA